MSGSRGQKLALWPDETIAQTGAKRGATDAGETQCRVVATSSQLT